MIRQVAVLYRSRGFRWQCINPAVLRCGAVMGAAATASSNCRSDRMSTSVLRSLSACKVA